MIQALLDLDSDGSWNGELAALGIAVDTWCSQDGSEDSGPYDPMYCFTGSYSYSLLVDGYGLPTNVAGLVTTSGTLDGWGCCLLC